MLAPLGLWASAQLLPPKSSSSDLAQPSWHTSASPSQHPERGGLLSCGYHECPSPFHLRLWLGLGADWRLWLEALACVCAWQLIPCGCFCPGSLVPTYRQVSPGLFKCEETSGPVLVWLAPDYKLVTDRPGPKALPSNLPSPSVIPSGRGNSSLCLRQG